MRWTAHWQPFDAHPASDSCWSLSAGPDRRVYAAVCHEYNPGGTAVVARWDAAGGRWDDLFNVAEAVDDPPESGRATQCKIHYGFCPSPGDGVLYLATHVTAPGLGRKSYSPWADWDSGQAFRGSALAAYDIAHNCILWWRTLYPREGCRCMCLDAERGVLYSISYPRDHLWVFDLETKIARDLGRIGSVNAQALFTDSRGRVWTSCGDGHLMRYDPAAGRLERAPEPLPHDARMQDGWHTVLYDAVGADDGETFYMTPWNAAPRLMRFRPNDGAWGRVEDLGALTQREDPSYPVSSGLDHAGGLVFGPDGRLYYVASRWGAEVPGGAPALPDGSLRNRQAALWAYDPATNERVELTTLDRPEATSHYVSRGAIERSGDFFFATSLTPPPVGAFRVETPMGWNARDVKRTKLRMWG